MTSPWYLLIIKFGLFVTLANSSSPTTLSYRVTEEQPPRTLIACLSSDEKVVKELTPNFVRRVTFHMLGESRSSRYFHLEKRTGNLSLSAVIDRDALCPGEVTCEAEMQVAVYPAEFFRVFKIKITIEDINDNPPTFLESSYHIVIPEDAAIGERFPLPTATDVDSPAHGIAEYRLPSAPANFKLDMDVVLIGDLPTKRAHLVLTRELNREVRDRYSFALVCYDSGRPRRLSGSTTVEVEVGDVNDNNPIFEKSLYEVSLPEDAPVGTTVARVRATDADAGLNGRIRYSLSSKSLVNYGSTFVIDEERGDVVLLQNLDHSKQSAYNISVIAQDHSESSVPSMATIFLTVIDVNDHAPQISVDFLTESGRMELSENQHSGVFIGHVSVSDADDGMNGAVVCDLDGNELKLVPIYRGEFKLVSNKVFNREEFDRYDINLRCHDLGMPQLWTNRTLVLHILDVNDNLPVFEQSHYETAVPESIAWGSFVLKVSATDEDGEIHGQVFYSIESANVSGDDVSKIFHVDSDTGVVTTIGELDRERVESYDFHILARNKNRGDEKVKDDSGAARVSARVVVTDLDDNGPMFAKHNFTFHVSENLPPRSIVGSLSANDADAPPNNAFSYRLVSSGDGSEEVFRVDANTGVVTTRRPLDREVREFYELKVDAISKTGCSRNDSARVFIRVDDVNDNPPVFVFPPHDDQIVRISLNHPIGAEVVAFVASDADIGTNADLTYEMVAGDAADYFRLDKKTGSLQLSKAFQKDDVNKTCSVTVRVRDSGQFEQLEALTTLAFVVVDSQSLPLQSPMHGVWELISDRYFIIIASFLGLVLVCIVLVVAFVAVTIRKLRENKRFMKSELDNKLMNESQPLSSLLISNTSLLKEGTTDCRTLSGIPDILDSELRIERVKVDEDEFLRPPTFSSCYPISHSSAATLLSSSRQGERGNIVSNNDDVVMTTCHYDDDSGCYVMNEMNQSHARCNERPEIYGGGSLNDFLNKRKVPTSSLHQQQLFPLLASSQCRHHDSQFHPFNYNYPHPLQINYPTLPPTMPQSSSQMTCAGFAATSAAAEILTASLLRQKSSMFPKDLPQSCLHGSLRNKMNVCSTIVPQQDHVDRLSISISNRPESFGKRPNLVTHQYLPSKDLKSFGVEESSHV